MDLAKSFGNLDAPTGEKRREAKPAAPRKPAKVKTPTATPADKAWTRGEGKSSNADYKRLTVYVPKELRKRAERKWEDETGRDASDLVTHLLIKYLEN